MLWNADGVVLEPIAIYDQIITVLVRQPLDVVWIMSAVYASPNAFFWEDLWTYLQQLGCCIPIPWMILGDFNHVLLVTEKQGGCPAGLRNMVSLRNVMLHCSLVNLGYSGCPFTWSNMRVGAANIKERLDRGLGNQAFLHKFPTVMVTHLPPTRSDHHPILLKEPSAGIPSRFERPLNCWPPSSLIQVLWIWSRQHG